MEFSLDVKMAIELAAKDVAKATSDRYSLGSLAYFKIKKDTQALISAAVAQNVSENMKVSWTDDTPKHEWMIKEADTNEQGWDLQALRAAVSEWFGTLGTEQKYEYASALAGYDDTVFVKNIVQKFESMAPGEVFAKYDGMKGAYDESSKVSRSREHDMPEPSTPDSTEDVFESNDPEGTRVTPNSPTPQR